MIYLFVFNYFCFRVHYLLTSAGSGAQIMGVQSKKAVSPGKNGLKMGGKG